MKLILKLLKALDEKIVNSLEHLRVYQNNVKRAYNKKIKPKDFKVRNLVLIEN